VDPRVPFAPYVLLELRWTYVALLKRATTTRRPILSGQILDDRSATPTFDGSSMRHFSLPLMEKTRIRHIQLLPTLSLSQTMSLIFVLTAWGPCHDYGTRRLGSASLELLYREMSQSTKPSVSLAAAYSNGCYEPKILYNEK
jgi:hypothetical protein